MALKSPDIPIISWDEENDSSFDKLAREIFKIGEDGEVDSNDLESNASVRSALSEFYNDIKDYKATVKEIKQVGDKVAIDSVTAEKYSLFQRDCLSAVENDVRLKSREYKFPEKLKLPASYDDTVIADSGNLSPSNSAPIAKPKKSKKSIMKLESSRKILVAEPNLVEFRNCEVNKNYKKSVVLRNVDTQLARFEIEGRPSRSAFELLVEKRNVAPGMQIRVSVIYRCRTTSEPEEQLVVRVRDGKPVVVKLRVRRDPPRLEALLQTFVYSSSPSVDDRASGSTTSSSWDYVDSSKSSEKSYPVSDVFTESSCDYDDNNNNNKTRHLNFDCKRCFVGEFVYVTTTLKNVGGKGRFFVMNEVDWCCMNIEDVTHKNTLVISPFAIWPAYFTLRTNEQLTLYTYFFPASHGLQVDELYFVSDNCAVKTFEIIGDGIMLEPQLLRFDKKVKYQWFKEEGDKFCTIRYLDLGSGVSGDTLSTTIKFLNKCVMDLHYRWEIDDERLQCPNSSKYTVDRKAIRSEYVDIEPSSGIFKSNTSTNFEVSVGLWDAVPARYRATVRLIIEDLPLAAIPEKYNFSCRESRVKRRLCDNPVDVTFASIELRFSCASPSAIFDREDSENVRTEKLLPSTPFTEDSFWISEVPKSETDSDDNDDDSSSNSSSNDDVCRFIKGYGTCDCYQTILISNAVLRPEGPLFVGVEHTFTVTLTNASPKRLKYWWGSVLGSDRKKIKIRINPRFDYVMPNSSEIVKIKCFPLETGEITSIYIPCQSSATTSTSTPLLLSIECTVKALCVAFFYPLTCERNIRVEWSAVEEYISRYDKKSGRIKLFRPKLKEERLLHLSMYDASRRASEEDASLDSGWEGEEADDTDTLLDSTIEDCAAKSWIDEKEFDEDEDDEASNKQLIPYFDFDANVMSKNFRYLPLIVEFHVLPGTSSTRRFYLQNETPISSYFRIRTKYFWKGDIDEQFRRPYSNEAPELTSGLNLSVEPEAGEIKPYEVVYFDVTAKSNTWGTYTDEIVVNIDLLPQRSFWIKIVNDSSPISYPVCKNSAAKIPRITFTVPKHGFPVVPRKLLIENTSDIPLYINWHCFITDRNVEAKPFNVIVDMLTPFMSVNEFLSANPNFYDAVKRFFSCAFNPYTSDKNVIIESSGRKSDLSSSLIPSGGDFEYVAIGERSDESLKVSLESSDRPKNNDAKQTEFQVSIVPYYGTLDYDIFVIKPQELFLPPKEKRYVSIGVNTEKLDTYAENISCIACGFIRIPPLFKYKDNVYFRKDGYYLPPTQVNLECLVKRSTLYLRSDSCQRTFEFYAKDFLQLNEIEVTKNVLLINKNEDVVKVSFEVDKPFRITKISTQREIFCDKRGSIHPNESVEIKIKCRIDKNWTDALCAEERGGEKRYVKHVVREVNLSIKYRDGFVQSIPVFLKINLPTLYVSANRLDFGEIIVGESKFLSFEIRNLSDRPQWLKIRRTGIERIVSFYPSKALLASKGTPSADTLQVKVTIFPREQGILEETLNVISEIDGFVAKCDVKCRVLERDKKLEQFK